MPISIEEGKAFIVDATKARDPWLTVAERSWGELKKRQRNNRLWSITPNSLRKRSRYPVWYSIFKIRQPLLLSRIGIPIGKDTTQDGNDNVGATAAICLERLAINLARSFNFFDVMAAARDDFLATNFGLVRSYYERDEIKQQVKEYITPQKDPANPNDYVFVNADGKVIESDEIGQDDEGYFIEHDQTVDVENEKICLRPILYKKIYIDPGITDWEECERIAFEIHYSEPQFKKVFGTQAFLDIPKADDTDEASPKKQTIKVFEYWDKYESECYWWAEQGTKFIKPQDYLVPDNEEFQEPGEYLNGLYNLENLFPCPAPLIMNSPTDEFWPVPEYYQLVEIFEDIHTIFSRMVALTKAIRARLLFDNNVEGLQEALNEATEGDAFGVANLVQTLTSAGGSLENVVQYIPVEKLINGLNQLYTALEQRLNIVYKLSGTSDLLQGLITDTTDRTLGERQMLEKYALNQSAEPQRKMQEFVRDSYQLICEMALKNFKDASLDMYIMPQTLEPQHKDRYRAALGMLKENQKRFRIELETDSTIALNEDYDKKMRVELVNALTGALEKTAQTSSTNPALAIPELHAMKYLIQGFRQGKMFQDEILQSIDQVIAQAQQAKPPFDAALFKAQSDAKFQETRAQALIQDTQTNTFKVQRDTMREDFLAQIKAMDTKFQEQIESLRLQLDEQTEGAKVQNQMADNQRLEEQLAFHESQPELPQTPPIIVVSPAQQAPQIQQPPIVIPIQGAPQQGPTIINAPNQPPQTSVIQPVQQVPVPINPLIPGGGGVL